MSSVKTFWADIFVPQMCMHIFALSDEGSYKWEFQKIMNDLEIEWQHIKLLLWFLI